MTGFGRGHVETKGVSVTVEFRSVNGKGLNCKLRVPAGLLEFETKVERQLRKELTRGSISGFVSVRSAQDETVDFDKAVLKKYLTAWRKTEKDLGLEAETPTLKDLIAIPGALQSSGQNKSYGRTLESSIKQAVTEAISALRDSRQKEGSRLAAEMLRLVSKLERSLKQASKRGPIAVKDLSTKYKTRVKKALVDAGEENRIDLARELIAISERADIQEEIARLEMHIASLRDSINGGGAAGREIEFILQECHREVTTLGNKSADSRLSAIVVDMKLCTQQLKEQVANVE